MSDMKQKKLLISIIVIFGLIVVAIFSFKDQIQKKAKEHVVGVMLDGFSIESAQTRFLSYAASVAPLKRLELGKINQLEVFERSSQVKLFWDHFRLPEVVVRATVPVEYRYYIELDGQWRIDIKDGSVNVLAPALLAGTPSPDISRLKFEVQKGSLFRNEVKVAEALQKDLSEMLQVRAQQSSYLVRETAREQLSTLVKQWLTAESKSAHIFIRFADENMEIKK
jgi:hypothetical protein